MGVNKEDFRHFTLDSHKSVGKVLLSKQPLEKCSVWIQEKTLLCLSAGCGIYCQAGHCQTRGKGSIWGCGCLHSREAMGAEAALENHGPTLPPTPEPGGKAALRGQRMGVSHEGWAGLLSAVNLPQAL